uniref:Uncharacterized protein n=1 Tax=Fagus sylvatica TaxID=28930 RepID=A0A2N9EQ93_FAGSY
MIGAHCGRNRAKKPLMNAKDCKGLENGYTCDQKLATKAKDGCKGDQRNIGMHHVEAPSNEQMDAKIRIYTKKRSEKVLSLEKYDDQNRLKTLVKDVTRRSTGGQRQRSKVTADVSSQRWSTESKCGRRLEALWRTGMCEEALGSAHAYVRSVDDLSSDVVE